MSRPAKQHRYDYLIGSKKGKLTVVSIEFSSVNTPMVICRCGCGGRAKITASDFVRRNEDGLMCHQCHCILNGERKHKSHEIANGTKFNRLTVESCRRVSGRLLYVCKCECGREVIAQGHDLKIGKVKSCGCYHRDSITKHGMYKSKLYGVWSGMRDRCTNKNNICFSTYGGRGISVCKEWRNFKVFSKWAIEHGYYEGCNLTIDRIDNDKGYCPENCRITTNEVQQNNRRDNHFVTYKGARMTIAQLARKSGLPDYVVRVRVIKNGLSPEEAVSKHYHPKKKI